MIYLTTLVALSSFASYVCADPVNMTDALYSALYESKLRLTSDKLHDDIELSSLQTSSNLLQTFADRSGGTRAPGSKGYDASVGYFADTVAEAGHDVTRQSVSFVSYEVLAERLDMAVGEPIRIWAMKHSPSTPIGGLTRPLVQVPVNSISAFASCEPRDFSDAKDKIAVIAKTACPLESELMDAKAAGVVALLVHDFPNKTHYHTIEEPNDAAYIPIGGISYGASLELAQRVASARRLGKPLNATLEIVIGRDTRRGVNIIASSKFGNQSNVVLVGAHLDSIDKSPGLNDGSVAVLELALQLAKYKLTNAVRFAWWATEQYEPSGSKQYLASLPESERKKIALYIDLNALASPNGIYGVLDGDNSTGMNPSPAPLGSGVIAKMFRNYFNSQGRESVSVVINETSNYSPFTAKGIQIPVGGLSSRTQGLKTAQEAAFFGGTAGEVYDINWHTRSDTYDKLNWNIFLAKTKAAAYVLAELLQSTQGLEADRAAQSGIKLWL